MELFSQKDEDEQSPLAYRMCPRDLDEYIGQEHIVGEGRLLRRVIQADRLSSLIFYGPPGTGKTSLARVIANTTESAFTSLNAVLSGVKELREQIEKAKERFTLYRTRSILFVDEVHRWNKAQQDALLPWVENGTVVLIGATTQNPYFEVNAALVSRSRIFQLTPLNRDELLRVARQALEDPRRGYGAYRVEFEEGALEHLVDVAAGDARSLLGAIELAVETSPKHFPPADGQRIYISLGAAEESIRRKAILYDKEGDYHFDVISAFIKSLRGSDPDAALYWLAKMVQAGEDPKFIFRRMLISASEDVGMADPYALSVVESAASAFERVGMPEGRYHLTHAALYLATAPKSNSALGFFDALEAVKREGEDEVPRHLKDANRDKEGFGHGEGYLYPHAYREHWVAQQYLPRALQGRLFYRPTQIGREANIFTEVQRRREANLAAMIGEESPEILTYSPPDKERERWLARLVDNRSASLLALRDRVFELLAPARHHRILDLKADDGLLLWEALRRAPEGGVSGIVENEETRRRLERYAEALELTERPVLYEGGIEGRENYDRIVGRNTSIRECDKRPLLGKIYPLPAEGGRVVLAETVPKRSCRLSSLPEIADLPAESKEILRKAEMELYNPDGNPLLQWEAEDFRPPAKEIGFRRIEIEAVEMKETRQLREADFVRWFSGEEENRIRLRGDLAGLLAGRTVNWKSEYALILLEK